jgi:hypothetical protein
MGSKYSSILKKLKDSKKKTGVKFTSDKKKFIESVVKGRGKGGSPSKLLYRPKSSGGRDEDSSRSRSSSSSSPSPSPSSGGGGSSGQRTTGPSNEQGFSFYEGTEGMTPAEFDLYSDIKLRGIDAKNANKLQNIINQGKLEVAVIQRDASIYGSLVSGFW